MIPRAASAPDAPAQPLPFASVMVRWEGPGRPMGQRRTESWRQGLPNKCAIVCNLAQTRKTSQ